MQLDALASARHGALYYIAGPTPFVLEQHDKLSALGIADDSVRIDDFESYNELWPDTDSACS
jgi:ferredoxin-NADP reductase